jgi:hypothetical protein
VGFPMHYDLNLLIIFIPIPFIVKSLARDLGQYLFAEPLRKFG